MGHHFLAKETAPTGPFLDTGQDEVSGMMELQRGQEQFIYCEVGLDSVPWGPQ